MKRTYLTLSVAGLISLAFCQSPGLVEHIPQSASIVTLKTDSINQYNAGLFDHALNVYVSSGKYNEDLAKVANQALLYLKKRIIANKALPHPKKLALVLDIDETSLSNLAVMQDLGFGYNADIFSRYQDEAKEPAIQPILSIYRYAIHHDVTVFFVTGRPQTLNAITAKNLKQAGFAQYQALYLKPNNYHQSSVIAYKSGVRKSITAKGYDIVLNIGDQYSDLEGGYADKAYKLPNPFYYLP